MAQTIEEIFNELVSEKQNQTELNALMPQYNLAPPSSVNPFVEFLKAINTESKTGMWRLWLFIVAVAIRSQQVFFDKHLAEVNDRIANHKPGTILWYRQQAFEFQDGDELVWFNNSYVYLVEDADAKIVAQCSVKELNGEVRIKVAAADASGNLIALSAPQLLRLKAYFQRIKYAGIKIAVVSFSADDVLALFNFKYDALYDLVPLKAAAKAAVKNYLKSLAFDGSVNLNGIIDALQAVPGVVDAVPVQFEGKYGLLPYTSYLAQGEYPTNAGYAVLDETNFDTANWDAA